VSVFVFVCVCVMILFESLFLEKTSFDVKKKRKGKRKEALTDMLKPIDGVQSPP